MKKKVVVIGGGTGSFTLLSALKDEAVDLTALVNMADDGGSTGLLRDELGVLPPGDVRQCLVALSNAPQARDLFNYRFDEGSLKGHAFGNLFLTALEKMTGDFAEGVELASKVLNVSGHVEPMTLTNVKLKGKDASSHRFEGEFEISHAQFSGGYPELWLEPQAALHPAAREAIAAADMIVIAPGSLYGSLAPALLVDGVGEALKKARARKVYVCNLVTKPGQTDNFAVHDYVAELERLAGTAFVDVVLYNTAAPDAARLEKYAQEGEHGVQVDETALAKAAYKAVGCPLLAGAAWENQYASSDPIAQTRSLIRHDAEAVAKALLEVLNGKY